MGFIGFMFNLKSFKNRNFFSLGEIKLNIDFMIIFVERKDLNFNQIIGFEKKMNFSNCDFFYFDEKKFLKRFFIFDGTKFRYTKISTTDTNSVDLKSNLIWLKPKEYKFVYELLHIVDLNFSFKKRIEFLLKTLKI